MASKIDICNQALSLIGVDTITSLTEDSAQARLMNEFFTTSLQTLLQEAPWNFAIKRATLAKDSVAPEYEYSYAYPLPSDCLQVISFESENIGYEYSIEDEKILTDLSPCKIKYVYEVTDMNKLSPLFRMALISYLASQIAPFLTNSAQYAQGAAQQFILYMRKAKVYNARESRKYKSQEGSWLTVRYGGTQWQR